MNTLHTIMMSCFLICFASYAVAEENEKTPLSLLKILPSQNQLPPRTKLKKMIKDEELPFGITSNPYVSSNQTFVAAFAKQTFSGEIDASAIKEALFSCYEENSEIGVFAFLFNSTQEASAATLKLPNKEDRHFRFAKGKIVVFIWHDPGVSSNVFLAFQKHIKIAVEQKDSSNSDSAVAKPEYLTDANRELHRSAASTLSKHEKRQDHPCGPVSCITKQDLTDANRELHRSVISTLSKHERRREHPYHAWGEVVEITEDDALPYNNAGWFKVVRYRIAVIHHPISSSHPDKSTPNCIVYSQGFRLDEKITRAFAVGERVALGGNIVKYPWEWGKDGRDAAEAVGSDNEKKCKVEK